MTLVSCNMPMNSGIARLSGVTIRELTMRFAKLAAAAAALSMATAPAVAAVSQPTSAAKLSLSGVKSLRTATGLKKSSKAASALVVVLAVIAVGAGIGVATGLIGDNDSGADSN